MNVKHRWPEHWIGYAELLEFYDAVYGVAIKRGHTALGAHAEALRAIAFEAQPERRHKLRPKGEAPKTEARLVELQRKAALRAAEVAKERVEIEATKGAGPRPTHDRDGEHRRSIEGAGARESQAKVTKTSK